MKYMILAAILPCIVFGIPEDTDMTDYIEVEILPLMGFTAVGMLYTGDEPAKVMILWEDFVQRIDEIPECAPEDDGYGVLLDYNEITGEFSYLAAVAVDTIVSNPEGMMSVDISPGTYAVFTFLFDRLDTIYEFVYFEWLPESGFTHAEGYDFEFYPQNFIPSEEGVLMQLYVSVEETE